MESTIAVWIEISNMQICLFVSEAGYPINNGLTESRLEKEPGFSGRAPLAYNHRCPGTKSHS